MSHPPDDAAPSLHGASANSSNVTPSSTREGGAAAISRFLRLLYRPGDVFEVRAFKCRAREGSNYTATTSGYFTYDAIDEAAAQIAGYDDRALAPGWYVTLNPVRPDLLGRALKKIKHKAEHTTGDDDIPERRRILIDVDPKRDSGVSSTDDELRAAEECVLRIRADLRAAGWPEPLIGMSGNGGHLVYAAVLPAADDQLVERFLHAMAARYDTDRLTLDTTVYNPSRITKVLGTMARKGDDLRGIAGVADRPHRRSFIVSAPDSLAPVPRELIEAIAATAPPPPKKGKNKKPAAAPSGAGPAPAREPAPPGYCTFDHDPAGVRKYLEDHNAAITGTRTEADGTWLFLAACPVVPDCPSISGTDIGVWVGNDGALGYSNKHNRGKDLRWVDLREALEPGYREHSERLAEDEREPAQRDKIVALAKELYRFGRSEADEPFAVLRGGANVARMLRGAKGALRAELAREYTRAQGRSPSSSALADALLVLEGECMIAAPEPVHLRLARRGDAVVLDLGDVPGRAVVIDAGGWRVMDTSPVLFRRTALTVALPVPVPGGSLDRLRAMLNVAGSAWPLTLGWLIACLIPDIEHPIVLLGGQQDAGKSTTGRALAGLIDPSSAALRAPPRDIEQWAVSAVGSWVVVIDNISVIPDWLSDAFCRAVTGDGLVRRALYSNDDLSVLAFQRCLILTSIDAGGLKGDLGRRMLLLDLEPLGKGKKRPPRRLRREYDQARPEVLGAMLGLLSGVLRELPSVHLDEFHGLADFEEVLAAMDRVTGMTSLAQYRAQWERIAEDVVDGDMIATAIREFAERQQVPWTGKASELFKEVVPEDAPKGWPKSARGFGGIVRRLIPPLLAVGVEVKAPPPNDKRRVFEVRLIAPTAQPPKDGPGDARSGTNGLGGGAGEPPGGASDRPAAPLERDTGEEPGAAGPNRPGDRPPDSPASHPAPERPSTDSGRLGDVGGPPHTPPAPGGEWGSM